MRLGGRTPDRKGWKTKGKGRWHCFERLLATSDPFCAAYLSTGWGAWRGSLTAPSQAPCLPSCPGRSPGLDRLGQGHPEPERVPHMKLGRKYVGFPLTTGERQDRGSWRAVPAGLPWCLWDFMGPSCPRWEGLLFSFFQLINNQHLETREGQVHD